MVIRRGSADTLLVALCALVWLAGCALLPPASPLTKPKRQPTSATNAFGSMGPVSKVKPAAISVYATDANGREASNVLVLLHTRHARPEPDATLASLDIVERHFEPAVLAVHVGNSVQIENLDGVPHDVYSFSKARSLSLRLAPGERGKKLRFPRPGLVTVGCKIDNDMRGYIYVTDATYFGKTDGNGFLRLSGLAPGTYRVTVWRADSPNAEPEGFPRTIKLEPGEIYPVPIRFQTTSSARADALQLKHNP